MKRTEKMIRRYYLLLGIIGLLGTAYFLGHHAGAIGQQLSSTNSTAANLTIGWLFDFGVEREKRATDANDNDTANKGYMLKLVKTSQFQGNIQSSSKFLEVSKNDGIFKFCVENQIP